MMNKSSLPLYLIIILILTGCLGDRGQQIDIIERALFSGSSSIGKKDLKAVELGEKAVVISRCTAFTPPVGLVIKNHSPIACQTRWRNENEPEALPIELSSSKNKPVSINVVTPGRYHLEYFIAYNDDIWNTYASTIHKADELKDIATFNVSGGEVIYLGDIELNLKNEDGKELLIYNSDRSLAKSGIVRNAISLSDNLKPARDMLIKSYPTLESKLRKSLIQLHAVEHP